MLKFEYKIKKERGENMSKEFEKILSEIGEVKEKVSEIDEIKEKLSEIDEIKEKVSKIDSIEETLEVVKNSVIKMEDKINRELPALYEVYDLNYILQKEKEKKIDSLENISDNLTYRVDSLENTVKEHSIKLKKLIS